MTADAAIAIRKAVPADVPILYRLIRELAVYEKIEHEVIANEETIAGSLFGPSPAAEAVLAFAGGDPAGFAVFFGNFSTFVGRPGMYIEDIYVRPEYRGAGVGKALLAHLARIARERRAGRIEFAVLDWNPARGFYEHLGARAMTDWVFYRFTEDRIRDLAGS
ncbi:MAG: GNAT family N-acetyltransferase [Candidatus Latescibacterota bacterium]|jgi:GNAT superfamily N-acetyltransferase|nr:MAG: GNAT family N-acetyltransferase [Candidatus Latescibacterota bacterium]